MLDCSTSDGVTELVSPMPAGLRVVFALLALVPLIAPYDLLVKPRWDTWLHPAFLVAAAVALGAMAVSGFLLFAAAAGLDQRLRFDTGTSTVTYWRRAPLVPARSVAWRFDAIASIDVDVHGWSEGPDSYSIRVTMTDGTTVSTGSTSSREQAEQYAYRVRAVVRGGCVG